jgi:putative alpha-1,2-mannosidase
MIGKLTKGIAVLIAVAALLVSLGAAAPAAPEAESAPVQARTHQVHAIPTHATHEVAVASEKATVAVEIRGTSVSGGGKYRSEHTVQAMSVSGYDEYWFDH